jgi:tetratricopeptide (TPR) repeat protein
MRRLPGIVAALCLFANARAADADTAFAAANGLYEQGKFAEAAAAFQQVIDGGARTADAWFNLGNARFKAGQPGLAIAAYRQAGQLNPRDGALRKNLDFVRRKAAGGDAPLIVWWIVPLRFVTLNEWAGTAACFLTALFLALAANEWRGTRRSRGLIAALALGTVVCGSGAAASYCDIFIQKQAVVTARQATVRFGPLPDSQVAFQLNDGAELAVSDASGDWLQIRDPAGRTGWLKSDDVLVLRPAFPR